MSTSHCNGHMTVTIQDIIAGLDRKTPFSLAESWDNVGLLVGNPARAVSRVLIGLDPSTSLVDEAISRGADTILTHHPVIFKPLPRIDTSSPEGALLEKALCHSIAIIACHTNLDSATDGVSDILATELGLGELTPLVPAGAEHPEAGLGRVGSPWPSMNFSAAPARCSACRYCRWRAPCRRR